MTYLRSVRKERADKIAELEAKAAAHKASLKAAFDADLLALFRTHCKVPELKAQLVADAVKVQHVAQASLKLPLDALLLDPKHAELYKLLTATGESTETSHNPTRDLRYGIHKWLSDRPAIRLCEKLLAKEFGLSGDAASSSVSAFGVCIYFRITVYIA